jgi:hypothetical protein
VVAAFAVMAMLLPAASAARAADGVTMTARVLLQGHTRIGSWMAIEVRVKNDGPAITGELRLQAGTEGGTRFATAADLPTTSDKTFVLHAQPPSFGGELEVVLAGAGGIVARQKMAVTVHDATQTIVGVVAERPAGIAGNLNLPQAQNAAPASAIVPLAVGDLPSRIEAWSALDRLVWQDVDSATLTADQIASLRSWIALGGRLVIVGGTAGIGSLAGFPDDILPYRPTATVDVAPEAISNLLGSLPSSAADVPAMSGELVRGQALARSGDRVVAAETRYGSGAVTIIGFDPAAGWIGESKAAEGLWRSVLPARSNAGPAITSDQTLLQAINNLPSLALPPIGGLLLLLLGYIALIGPINYVVLRRLDRREWAWITMPALIIGFAVGAYAFGSALRGSSVIVNEVAIVRGAPDATEGAAQVYLGVFSPARGTYQVAIRGGALLSSPISGDAFGGGPLGLDVVQGDPSRVRNLSVGFGSLRAIRAESGAQVPKVHAELSLVDGVLVGTIRNDSSATIERPAMVLGSNVNLLGDLKPGDRTDVRMPIVASQPFGPTLGSRIFGDGFFDGTVSTANEAISRDLTRRWIVDQLTFDPRMGGSQTALRADGPVLLGWGRNRVLDVQVENQSPQRLANVLYYVPVEMAIRGRVAFSGDLLTQTIIDNDSAIFQKDPSMMVFGQGTMTVSYRPLPFAGRLAVDHVRLQLTGGRDAVVGGVGGKPVAPVPDVCQQQQPPGKPVIDCPVAQVDGLPEVEVFDRTGKGTWHRLPHFTQNISYDLADPLRYVDATGSILVRFVNDQQNPVNALMNVSIEGTIQ